MVSRNSCTVTCSYDKEWPKTASVVAMKSKELDAWLPMSVSPLCLGDDFTVAEVVVSICFTVGLGSFLAPGLALTTSGKKTKNNIIAYLAGDDSNKMIFLEFTHFYYQWNGNQTYFQS